MGLFGRRKRKKTESEAITYTSASKFRKNANQLSVNRKRLKERIKKPTCEYCSKRIYWESESTAEDFCTIDHVRPRSKGGTSGIFNLVPCCRKCNGAKGNKSLEDFMKTDYYLRIQEAKNARVAYRVEEIEAPRKDWGLESDQNDGSASWTGVAIGDYIQLIGVRESTAGTSLGLDGTYRIRDIASSNLYVEPIGSAPTGADIAFTYCGGAVFRRGSFRIHYVRVFDFDRQRVETISRAAADVTASMPVSVSNTATVSITGTPTIIGSASEDAAASSTPVVVGGVVRTAVAPTTLVAGDAARLTLTTAAATTVAYGAPVAIAEVASAARTATGNSGVISVPTGGYISGLIVVSANSGTSQTLDITLEESYDNGTTFQQIWAAPRFTTSNGNTPIPPMAVSGIRRWVWTVSGTSPSFTFAINVNQHSAASPIVRKIFDRTANVLNGTAAATTPAVPITGCKQIMAKISLGAVTTTAGTYQLQISDDNANWASIGTATLAVANTITSIYAPVGTTADWCRLIVTSGATGQTGNYVTIHATS